MNFSHEKPIDFWFNQIGILCYSIWYQFAFKSECSFIFTPFLTKEVRKILKKMLIHLVETELIFSEFWVQWIWILNDLSWSQKSLVLIVVVLGHSKVWNFLNSSGISNYFREIKFLREWEKFHSSSWGQVQLVFWMHDEFSKKILKVFESQRNISILGCTLKNLFYINSSVCRRFVFIRIPTR